MAGGLLHGAFYDQTNHLGQRIGTNRNGLLEMAGELVLAVIGHLDKAEFAVVLKRTPFLSISTGTVRPLAETKVMATGFLSLT